MGTNTYAYDSAGRLSGFVNPHGQEIGYEYDVLGRTSAVAVRENAAAPWIRTEYGYDAAGNMTSLIEPDGDVVSFGYDAGNSMVSRSLPNGVESTWAYDIGGRVTSVSHEQADGTVIASRDYTRLPSGEPTRIERQDGSARNLTLDSAGRIETENIDDGAGSINTARRYAYDGDGNRTLRVLDEGTASEIAETSALSAGSELSAISRTGASTDSDAYTYDAAGRLTQLVRAGNTYGLTYSADDELVRLDKNGLLAFEATFDAEGRRIGTQHHGPLGNAERRFLIAASLGSSYESPHLVTDELGVLQASYVYAGEHALSRVASASETYYLRDALGTVIATVDEAGVVIGQYDYDAFGNSVAAAPSSASAEGEFAFQGMWQDAGVLGEVGLYYVRARMYDVGTGRFATRDPAVGRAEGPETYWPYAFGNGNPEWARDPTGRYATLTNGGLQTSLVVMSVFATLAIAMPKILKMQSRRHRTPGCRRYGPYEDRIAPPLYRASLPTYQRSVRYRCRAPLFPLLYPSARLLAEDLRRKDGIPTRPLDSYESFVIAVGSLEAIGLSVSTW